MSEVKVPEGYKQTEVGVIPKDWEIKPLGAVVKENRISSGLYKDKNSYGSGTSIIKLGDVFSNDIFNPNSVQKVEADEAEIQRYKIKVGDLIVALASVKLEGVGKVMHVTTLEDETIFDHNVALIRTTESINSYFLSYTFKSNYIRSMIASKATQVGTTFLKSSTILQFNIILPTYEEQTAIANALSDIDDLIGSLEKLIAKKEAIKTATMQQLLTGKTRLPEFATREDGSVKGFKQTELGRIPEDWQIKSYADIFTFLSTSSNSRADLSNSGDYGYIHYGDIHTKWHTRLDLSKTSLPKISENLVTSAFVQHGDIVIADASEDYEGVGKSIELSNQSSNPVVSGLHTFLLRDKNEQLSDGFRGLINDIPVVKASIQRLATGLKVYGISKKNLMTVMIPFPHKKEQTAIATILSDMDAEIQVLQQRLEKTKDIKQGMMQQLLTGKVRLLDSSAKSDIQTLASKGELQA